MVEFGDGLKGLGLDISFSLAFCFWSLRLCGWVAPGSFGYSARFFFFFFSSFFFYIFFPILSRISSHLLLRAHSAG